MAGSGYQLFTAGATLTAAQVNTYLNQQTMMVFASAAARDSALSAVLAEGLHCYLLDVNTITVYSGTTWSTIGPVHGVLTTWTPVITQSTTVTYTLNYARYQRIGRWIHGAFNLSITGTGVAANNVVISGLPNAVYADVVHGTCLLFDFSAGFTYQAFTYTESLSTITLRDTTVANAGKLGTSVFTAALGASDNIEGTFAYEAAVDA